MLPGDPKSYWIEPVKFAAGEYYGVLMTVGGCKEAMRASQLIDVVYSGSRLGSRLGTMLESKMPGSPITDIVGRM